ncbi:hypothetical protein O1611_g10372 [Lasiodiplodia mahajangana]|uniref:Uncharacterized protein n=1 Tax=Lasiodiplodia mahajangana TaxID=1108764 RepID=A0ACC2IZ56_9PEZI|nr:hypothetical protein O1611_g10372 [Lasiodiplodia mahajangana]
MPLSREPSQRALAWVKWNSSKSSLNNHKRVAEPEIVHLGGARVGTAFEVLDLPAPDRSKPAERPPTQWAFNPPPPNPPGIGIAIAGPGGSPIEARDNHLNFENERPITQWFPEFQPGAEKKDETQNPATQTTYPSYLNTTTDAAEPELTSPSSVVPQEVDIVIPGVTLRKSPFCEAYYGRECRDASERGPTSANTIECRGRETSGMEGHTAAAVSTRN